MKYEHGGDIYTYGELLDFSININPFGPSQRVLEAAKRGVDLSGIYPDSRCGRLTAALAGKLSVPEGFLIFGNGAAELIFALATAERPKQALIPVPAFSEYEQALKAVGCGVGYHYLKQEENFRLTEVILDELTEEVDMVFLCSPSNPAGQTIEDELLVRIAEICRERQIRVVMDECFLDFAADTDSAKKYSLTEFILRFPNVFILRAFTKTHGIPGLRLGYAITADAVLAERIQSVRQPWSVSAPAQEAGLAALEEEERVRQARRYIHVQRRRMEAELGRAGMKVIPSEANFILFRAEENATGDFFRWMLEQGILIRDCSNYEGLSQGWYRVAVKKEEENERLLNVVRAYAAQLRRRENL